MPLLSSSAYGTAGQCTAFARSLLNDAPGNWATDSVLLPYVNGAYRDLQQELATSGVDLFTADDVLLVVPAVPAVQQDPGTQVAINDATPPPNQLPANLLVPLKLWERPNLSTQDFIEMQDLTEHDGLPSRLQGATLGCWEWRSDGLYFVGATQDTQIRLRFEAAFADLSGPNDVVMIRGATNAIAYAAAGLAGNARGAGALVQVFGTAGKEAWERIINIYARRQQNSGVRPRPYRSRQRGWGGLGGW